VIVEQGGNAAEYAEFIAWKKAQAAGNAALGRAPPSPAGPLKLDLGCGPTIRRTTMQRTREAGWTGVDYPGTDGADVFCDLAVDRWPFADNSVDEISCSHMLEHVPRMQRVHFFNEMFRVLKPGAGAQVITPHWASCRAYGDITHEWPPVSEMFWQYLDKDWRALNAPHLGLSCHFPHVVYGYITAAHLNGRSQEFIAAAVRDNKEAAMDMQANLTKPKAV
jgi:SAM-dependent methyltransferase